MKRLRSSPRGGFTLVEIMIVVAIFAIMMAVGIPSFVRVLEKDALRQAESDVVEACSHARAQAILSGAPAELVFVAETGQLSVRSTEGAAATGRGAFTATVGGDVGFAMLDVNLQDQMDVPEARVRFFPNGTCDEFTVVLESVDGGMRKITLEVTTGLAEVEVLR